MIPTLLGFAIIAVCLTGLLQDAADELKRRRVARERIELADRL